MIVPGTADAAKLRSPPEALPAADAAAEGAG
jgi:hypothetical protein